MKVTGYQLREALKQWNSQKEITGKQFNKCVFQFAEERDELSTPKDVAAKFAEADMNCALLEDAQQRYNQQVRVSVGSETYSLSFAVKRIGGAARLAKMWRYAATTTGDRYETNSKTRPADTICAQRMIKQSEALEIAKTEDKFCSLLRQAIAIGNSKEIELDIDQKLFR